MKRIKLIRLLVLVLGVLIWQACSENEEPVVNQQIVSGVFAGENHSMLDSLSYYFVFSFDELADGTVEGGIRIFFEGDKGPFKQQKYLSHHIIAHWQEDEEGNTLLAGEVDFSEDMGLVAFSGLILGNDTLEYAMSGQHFNSSGLAFYDAPYLKESDITKTPVPNYLAQYYVTGSPPTPYDLENFPFLVKLIINSQYVSNGGILFDGYVEYWGGTGLPYHESAVAPLGSVSELIGNNLCLSLDDNSFILQSYNGWASPSDTCYGFYVIYPQLHHHFPSYTGDFQFYPYGN